MRVLHVGKYFPPYAGGIENFLGDLLPALSALDLDVHALVHRPFGDRRESACFPEERIERVTSYATLLYAPLAPGFPLKMEQVLKKIRPHLLHLHLPNTSAFWALFSPGARAIPWVVHWHADVVASTIDRRLAAAYTLYRPFEQNMLRRAVAVIATSPSYLDSSRSLAAWKDKCRVIPLGLNPERFPASSDALRSNEEAYWGRGEGLRVLSVGRLTYYKGHEVAIRAVARMKNVRLLIVGTGERRRELERLIRELGAVDRIRLTGLLDDDELHAMLASCDCFCLPSVERTEAFGLVLLEIMCYGKPVAVSDVPGSGMGWVVEDGRTGCLFPVGEVDALCEIFKRFVHRPDERYQMGHAGRERFLSFFHIDRIARETALLYHELASQD